MSAPLYFLPGIFTAQLAPGGQLSRSLLAARGLGEVLEDIRSLDDLAHADLATLGPGGKSGVIISAIPVESRELPRRLGYYPQDTAIEWLSFNGGLIWAAIDKNYPPTPADLARHKMLDGYPIEMADGQEWIVPILRRWPAGTALPQDWEWDDAGQFVQRIKARYQRIWESSSKTASEFFDSPSGHRINLPDATQRILDALALNYRLGRHEQRLLHLVDSTNWEDALAATVDLPKVFALVAQKKTEITGQAECGTPPHSANSGLGSTAASPTTSPAAETSTSPV